MNRCWSSFKPIPRKPKKAFEVGQLPPTHGEWSTLLLEADLQGATRGMFVLNHCGPSASTSFALSQFQAFDHSPIAAEVSLSIQADLSTEAV